MMRNPYQPGETREQLAEASWHEGFWSGILVGIVGWFAWALVSGELARMAEK